MREATEGSRIREVARMWCDGHGAECVLADVIVNIGFVGRTRLPFTYNLCIECAEAHLRTVLRWPETDLWRVREFWWAKHPNGVARGVR